MSIEIIQVEQGSSDWLKMRLGVITASNIYDLIPTIREKEAVLSKKDGRVLHPAKKTVEFKEARRSYMHQLIAEVCTGHYEELHAKALAWGKENEPGMIAAYCFDRGVKAKKGGFIYGKDKRVGCSPDILVDGQERGAEGKCPFSTKTHIDTILAGKVKAEYLAQIQFSLWVSGFQVWDFISYDPRMKTKMLHIETFERDPKMMALFDEIIPEFIHDFDNELAKLGAKWGDQWS